MFSNHNFLSGYLFFASFLAWQCLAISYNGQAQNIDLQFKHITTKDGLSQSRVNTILQDKQGFMWFGTWDGLNKYDGYKFTIYRNDPADSTSISSSHIVDMLEDREGNIWIATYDGGLNKFDRKTNSFIHYQHDPGKPTSISSNVTRCLFEDAQGTLWVGTRRGLNKFNKKDNTFIQYHHRSGDNKSLINDEVGDVLEDRKGNLWIGTFKGGLDRFDRDKNEFIHYQHDPAQPNSVSSNFILCLFEDSKGNLWIGTQGGVNVMDGKQENFTRYTYEPGNTHSLLSNVAISVEEDAQGRVWVGTDNGGLNIFDPEQRLFYRHLPDPYTSNGLNNASVYSIYRDKQQNMWVGTYSGGINFYDQHRKQFSYYQHDPLVKNSLSHNFVYAFAEDKRGNIWISTDGGGLNVFNPRAKTFLHYTHDRNNPNSMGGNYLTDIQIDQEDNIWVGAWGTGITRINDYGKVFTHYRHNPNDNQSLSSDYSLTFCEDKQGNLWVGTNGTGLDRFNKRTNQFTNFSYNPADSTSLSNNYILCLFRDSQNRIWIGTSGGGLNYFDPDKNQFTRYTSEPNDPKSLSNDYVYSIFEDSKANLWIATGNGLNLFDRKKGHFRVYQQKNGLPGNTINAIQEDNRGLLWISTNNGISQFNPQKQSFKNYSVADGLVGNEFTHAALRSRTGELYFGSPDGFTVFNPDSIKDNPLIPPVYITGFQVFNKEVPIGGKDNLLHEAIEQTKEITLSYKQTVFSFDFAAPNYTSPEKNQYAYKMENFDNDWNYIGNKRTATYTNLDAGTYYFRVKASNNDGLWNEKGTSIKITITPPFWRTWWFNLIAITGLLVGAIGFYGWRVNSVEAEKNQLESQNKALQKINTELDNFVYRASHDLRAPLTSILGLINISKTEKDETSKMLYLSLMEKSVQKLDTFIQSIINYSKNARTQVLSQPIDFATLLEESLEALQYQEGFTELDKRIEIHQTTPFYSDVFRISIIFNNVLSNAIKYRSTTNKPCWIRIYIRVDQAKALIELEDNGRGIAQESQAKIFEMFYRATDQGVGSGLGLYIVKEAVNTLKGNISLQSQPGIGSTFRIELPNEKGHS